MSKNNGNRRKQWRKLLAETKRTREERMLIAIYGNHDQCAEIRKPKPDTAKDKR